MPKAKFRTTGYIRTASRGMNIATVTLDVPYGLFKRAHISDETKGVEKLRRNHERTIYVDQRVVIRNIEIRGSELHALSINRE